MHICCISCSNYYAGILSKPSQMVAMGKIFSLVTNCLQTNPQEANQLLENIKQTIAKIVALINEEKSLQRELENEGESIQSDIGSLQQAQNSLRSDVDSLKARTIKLDCSISLEQFSSSFTLSRYLSQITTRSSSTNFELAAMSQSCQLWIDSPSFSSSSLICRWQSHLLMLADW